MRRVLLALAVCVGIQLILPPPAQAWWGWWDELSGAGPFRGWEIEARLVCFGEAVSHPASDRSLELAQRQFDYETTEFRTNPDADRGISVRLGTLSARLGAAVSPSVTVGDLSNIAADAARLRAELEPQKQPNIERVKTALDNLQSRLTESRARLERLKNQRGSAGVAFSACPIQRDNNRRVSINATFRLLRSYGDRKALYAGGNEIELAMLVPSIAWRPLVDFSWIDVIDLSTGAGVYWFSSETNVPGGFEPFRGLVLEPVRVDFHVPSKVTKLGWLGAVVAGASYRRGVGIFPHGFAADAFGATRPPAEAKQIPAEWIKTQAFFWDFGPLVHYAKVGRVE
jgi:hypothetical protein